MFDDVGPPGYSTALNLASTQVSHEADQNRSHSDMTWAAQFNADQSELAYQRQLNLRSTAYQASAEDMTKANLNPILMFNRGATATPSSQAAGIGPNTTYGGGPAAENTAATFLANAEIKNINAQADKTEAEKKEIEARTKTYPVSIDQMQQNIIESKERLQTYLATATREYASAGQANQQTQNLQAMLPQIRATVDQLRALTTQSAAQTELLKKQWHLTDQEFNLLGQKVRENLPQLEARLLQLEGQAKRLDMPRRGNEAALADSILGGFSALIKAFSPIIK